MIMRVEAELLPLDHDVKDDLCCLVQFYLYIDYCLFYSINDYSGIAIFILQTTS